MIMVYNCLPLLELANALCVYSTYNLEMNPMVADKDRVIAAEFAPPTNKRKSTEQLTTEVQDAQEEDGVESRRGVSTVTSSRHCGGCGLMVDDKLFSNNQKKKNCNDARCMSCVQREQQQRAREAKRPRLSSDGSAISGGSGVSLD